MPSCESVVESESCNDAATFIIPELAALPVLTPEEADALSTGRALPAASREDDAGVVFRALVLVRCAIAHHPALALACIDNIVAPFVVGHVGNLRSALSRHATVAAGELVRLGADALVAGEGVDAFVAALLAKATGDKRFIRDLASDALHVLAAAPAPTACLYMALARHSTTKNRTAETVTAALAASVLDRLPSEETARLHWPTVACLLAKYSSSRSADARARAHQMSARVCAHLGFAAWAAVLQGACKPQDCRDLTAGLEVAGGEVDVVDAVVDAPAVAVEEDKENSAALGAAFSPVRPGRRSTSVGGKGLPGLREFLREQQLQTSGGLARALGCGPGLLTPVQSGRLAGRPSLGRAGGMGGGSGFTPVLVLQRAAFSPAPSDEQEAPVIVPVGAEAEALLDDWCLVVSGQTPVKVVRPALSALGQ